MCNGAAGSYMRREREIDRAMHIFDRAANMDIIAKHTPRAVSAIFTLPFF